MVHTQVRRDLLEDFGSLFFGDFGISFPHLGFPVIAVIDRRLLEGLQPFILGLGVYLFFDVLSAGMKLFEFYFIFILAEFYGVIHVAEVDFIHE